MEYHLNPEKGLFNSKNTCQYQITSVALNEMEDHSLPNIYFGTGEGHLFQIRVTLEPNLTFHYLGTKNPVSIITPIQGYLILSRDMDDNEIAFVTFLFFLMR